MCGGRAAGAGPRCFCCFFWLRSSDHRKYHRVSPSPIQRIFDGIFDGILTIACSLHSMPMPWCPTLFRFSDTHIMCLGLWRARPQCRHVWGHFPLAPSRLMCVLWPLQPCYLPHHGSCFQLQEACPFRSYRASSSDQCTQNQGRRSLLGRTSHPTQQHESWCCSVYYYLHTVGVEVQCQDLSNTPCRQQ